MIRVLVVEDSPTIRELLVHVLSADPAITVAGVAETGEEALEALSRKRVDVVTMDIHMPGIGGLSATRKIMSTTPVPIVIVSSQTPTAEATASFEALQAGAVTVVPRLPAPSHPDFARASRELTRLVKLMSEVKVVRRWDRSSSAQAPTLGSRPPLFAKHRPTPEIVAIGGSTGAPQVLERILRAMPGTFPLPIVVVQHMAVGFMEAFADWLGRVSPMRVRIARDREELAGGEVYLAPDGHHLGIVRKGVAVLSDGPPEHGLRPAVSHLFRSVAEAFAGRAIGVLLSGMGSDGAEALRQLRQGGALTIAQDKESSVVHSMPGTAIALGGAELVLSPEQISEALVNAVIISRQPGMVAQTPPQ